MSLPYIVIETGSAQGSAITRRRDLGQALVAARKLSMTRTVEIWNEETSNKVARVANGEVTFLKMSLDPAINTIGKAQAIGVGNPL